MLLTWLESISQAANGEMCDVGARRSLLQKYHQILQLTRKCLVEGYKEISCCHVTIGIRACVWDRGV